MEASIPVVVRVSALVRGVGAYIRAATTTERALLSVLVVATEFVLDIGLGRHHEKRRQAKRFASRGRWWWVVLCQSQGRRVRCCARCVAHTPHPIAFEPPDPRQPYNLNLPMGK